MAPIQRYRPSELVNRRGGVVVVGQGARDLVLRADDLPDSGMSVPVSERIERLGGKGANIAVGLRQLNPDLVPSLIAVLGTDTAGALAHSEASDAGLDSRYVVRRGRTALLVDLVTSDGERRLFEDVPAESLLSPADILPASEAFHGASIVVLQLQQPADALLAAARLAAQAAAQIVIDGAIEGEARDELLAMASVVRADAREARLLTGMEIEDRADAARAASLLLAHGPELVALSVPESGDLLAWADGTAFYPHAESTPVDPTGAGDAFVAGLVTGLRRGYDHHEIGQLAADAASSTVQRLGGHPELAEPEWKQTRWEQPGGSGKR